MLCCYNVAIFLSQIQSQSQKKVSLPAALHSTSEYEHDNYDTSAAGKDGNLLRVDIMVVTHYMPFTNCLAVLTFLTEGVSKLRKLNGNFVSYSSQ